MSASGQLTGDAVSIHDIGALGDGNADDSAAIQRALDSDARIVTVPKGVYLLGSTLRIGSDTSLHAHPEAVFRFADGAGQDAGSFLLTNADHINGNRRLEVTGGIWDGNNEGNPRGLDGDPNAYTGVAINFVCVEHLRIADLTVRNPDSFSIRIGEAAHFAVENIRFDHAITRPNQDGVHVGGFSEDGYIRNLRAVTPHTTNDDMVALNADDDVERCLNLGMKLGPIRNMHVEGLYGESVYTFVRLLSRTQRLEDVRIRDLSGSCRYHVINLNNWRFPLGSGDIRNVDIRNVSVSKAADASDVPLIPVLLGVQDMVIADFRRPQRMPSSAPTLVVGNTAPNAVQVSSFEADALRLVAEGGQPAGVTPALVAGADRRVYSRARVRMQGGDRLVLAQGGFGELRLNCR